MGRRFHCMSELRGLRKLLYVMIVSVVLSTFCTFNAWIGVWMIQAGHLWWAIWWWGCVVFFIWEVNNE